MRQRVDRTALPILAAAGLAAVFAAAGLRPAAADENAAGADSDLPVLLLVQERPAANSPQAADIGIRLRTTLREALTHSGRFQVHTFLPGDSVIKRALNEHLIAADDLAEPHRVESLERIAKAIGARFILNYNTTVNRTEAHTELKYLDNPGRADWMVLADQQISIPLVIGKQQLKPEDIVNLTVDDITARVGVPTQLAASLRIKPGSRVFSADAPNGRKVEKDGTVKSGPKRPPTDHGADRSAATPGAPAITKPSPQSDTAVSANAKPGRPAGKGKGDPSTTTLSGGPATPGGQAAQRGKPVFTDAAEPVRGAATAPSVAPPPTVPKTDYEAQAARFRQTGDMSGAVVALRKAVNDKPRDIGVRRELIQVYQALQMPEAAHAEALRALRLDANNAALYRLYGEVLAAEGDTTGAMNAFQDGIKIDPSDIGCQIALGDALLAQNHFLQAVDSYTAASKIDPKSPLPHRRMARAFAARAGTDPDQYQASLAEVRSALDLSVPGDTTLYAEDYVAILRIVDGRIRDMLEEIQNAYEARVQLKKSPAELMREIADINQRSDAIATYLAKLAPATGYDVTQAHYVQSNALFSQAVGFFKDLVQTGEERYASSMKSGQVQAQRELAVAGQRLTGTRSNEKTRKP